MFLFSIFLLLLFKGATEGNIQDVDLRCTLEYCEVSEKLQESSGKIHKLTLIEMTFIIAIHREVSVPGS